MLEGVIDCDQLGIVPDIPAELIKLRKENSALRQSNRTLKAGLIVFSMCIGIYVTIKIINDERKEKERQTGRA